MNSLISVIVPIYNRELYLEKCIESIVNQSYKNLEIILVNDGSTDSSADICRRWMEKDSRIKLIDKENGGVSSARNAGLKEATGELVAFVDGDDFIHPDMYSVLLGYLSEDIDVVACRFIYFKNNAEVSGTHFESEKGRYTSDEVLDCFFTKQNSEWVSLCNKIIRKKLFEGLSFPEGRVFEDWAVSPFLYFRSNGIYYTDEQFYYYVVHNEESIFHKKSLKRYFDCVMNDYDHLLFFAENDCESYNSSIRFIMRADFRNMCKHYSISKNNRAMIKKAFKICVKTCGFKAAKLEIAFYFLRIIISLKNR